VSDPYPIGYSVRARGLFPVPPFAQCEVAGQRAATEALFAFSALFQPAPPERSRHLSAHYALRRAVKCEAVLPPLAPASLAGGARGLRAGAAVADVSDLLHSADGTSQAAAARLHPFPAPPCPPRAVCPGG
jgi:hypothetical protein